MLDYLTRPKKIVCGIAVICCFCLLILYKDNNAAINYSIFLTPEQTSDYNNTGYLVSSSKCRIPDLEAFNSDARPFFSPQKYAPCRDKELLTYVTKTDNIATLHVDNEIIPSYSKSGVACCYSMVHRQVNKNHPDDNISVAKCLPFEQNVTLHGDIVMVKCNNPITKKQVYENVHAPITIKKAIKAKMSNFRNDSNVLSVLFVGIDSISKLNFVRTMPKSYNFVEANGWIPLNGYNKIEDNTFPNVMGFLTGFNQTTAYAKCDPKSVGKLDHCPMLWYDFRKLGYVTAYAEDDVWITTFNYKKKGFTAEPTDYYFRPYMQASEKLKRIQRGGMTYCTGPETSGERIMSIAKDFAFTFKGYPSFSFFWMNTFSHNEINSPSGMDNKVKAFLEDLTNSGVLNETFVVFLSDHGIRFGEIRYTVTGWLEERLPFIYVSIPNWFKAKFKREYDNFINASHKLTTPYDLYVTLQHILVLSGFNYTIKQGTACPKCRSLFDEIDSVRSCEDAAIEQHWCTCVGYTVIDAKNETATKVVRFVISEIANIVHNKKGGSICANFTLKRIISASVSESFSYKNETYLLIVFETKPKAVFEATVLLDEPFSLVGGISRLDLYGGHSSCTEDASLKKYCYCR